jgi:hypothetical protein
MIEYRQEEEIQTPLKKGSKKMKIIKIGNVELTEDTAIRLYEEHKYIVTYSKIYALHWSNAQQGVYGTEIYKSTGLTRKGRFFAMDAASINHILGFKLLNEN